MVTENFSERFEVRPVETNITFLVTGRGERSLNKRYSKLEVDRKAVQMQLEAWGHHVERGKKLQVILSFSYVQADLQTRSRLGNVRNGNMTSLHASKAASTRSSVSVKGVRSRGAR